MAPHRVVLCQAQRPKAVAGRGAGQRVLEPSEGRRRVLDSVSWNLPGRVSGHFEGPGGGSQGVGGTVSFEVWQRRASIGWPLKQRG